jgi:hypothetical protein
VNYRCCEHIMRPKCGKVRDAGHASSFIFDRFSP